MTGSRLTASWILQVGFGLGLWNSHSSSSHRPTGWFSQLHITFAYHHTLSCIKHAAGTLRLVLHVQPAACQEGPEEPQQSVGLKHGRFSLIQIRRMSSLPLWPDQLHSLFYRMFVHIYARQTPGDTSKTTN